MRIPRPLGAILQLALLFYPFYIWWAITHWHPITAIIPLVLLTLIKSLFSELRSQRIFLLLGLMLMITAACLGHAEYAMLYYPVWINAGMLLLFGWSLCYPPTIVERLATLMEGKLDEKGVAYTRKVTWVWCVFFLLNGSIAAFTAWWGDWELWALYNGFIAYLLIGILMSGEWLVRRYVRAAQ